MNIEIRIRKKYFLNDKDDEHIIVWPVGVLERSCSDREHGVKIEIIYTTRAGVKNIGISHELGVSENLASVDVDYGILMNFKI